VKTLFGIELRVSSIHADTLLHDHLCTASRQTVLSHRPTTLILDAMLATSTKAPCCDRTSHAQRPRVPWVLSCTSSSSGCLCTALLSCIHRFPCSRQSCHRKAQMRVGGALVGSRCDVSRHRHPGRSYRRRSTNSGEESRSSTGALGRVSPDTRIQVAAGGASAAAYSASTKGLWRWVCALAVETGENRAHSGDPHFSADGKGLLRVSLRVRKWLQIGLMVRAP